MSRISMGAVPALLIGLAVSPSSYGADSCPAPCTKPPANARHVSFNGTLPNGAADPFLTATLAKGKAKRVLVADVTVHAQYFSSSGFLSLYVDVNGIAMEPLTAGNGQYSTECLSSPGDCTVSGTVWLDIDQNPSLINVPLTVTLWTSTHTPSPVFSGNASMSIRLEKK